MLVAGATGWFGLVVATPSWEARGSASLRAVALTFRAACGRVCHQRPDRSFHTDGRPWAVCARCTGLYAGVAAGAWLAALAALRTPRVARHRRAEAYRWPLVLAAVPTAATWAVEYAGITSFSNTARFVLAVPLGAVAAWMLTSMAAGRVE